MMEAATSEEYQEKYVNLKKKYKQSLSKREQLTGKLENARHKIRHLQKDTEKLIDAWDELQKRIRMYKKRERKRQRGREQGAEDLVTDDGDEGDSTTSMDYLSDSDDWSISVASERGLSSLDDEEDSEDKKTKRKRRKGRREKGHEDTENINNEEEDTIDDEDNDESDNNKEGNSDEDDSDSSDSDDRDSDAIDDEISEEEEEEGDIDENKTEEKRLTVIDSVPMDEKHQVIFPFSVGKGVNEVHIVNLGEVVPQKAGYDTARYVFPLGFTSRRRYLSCKHPSQRTTYTNRILMAEDQSEFPLFEVVADDDLQNPIRGHSCSGVWKTIKMRANETRKTPIKNASPSGPDYFGLSYPLVTFLIQRLPQVNECKKYIFQEFKWDGAEPIVPDHAMQSTPPPLHLIENLHIPSPEEPEITVVSS